MLELFCNSIRNEQKSFCANQQDTRTALNTPYRLGEGRDGGDVLVERLQMLHTHVLFTAPLSTGHVPQPHAGQYQGRVAVREGSHHAGAAADLPIQPTISLL